MLAAPFGKSFATHARRAFVATHYITLKHASNKNFVNYFPHMPRSYVIGQYMAESGRGHLLNARNPHLGRSRPFEPYRSH